MRVRVLLFGHYRDIAPEIAVDDLPEPATVADLARRLARDEPRLDRVLDRARVAVAADFATPDTPLRDGDEVAFLPPMSGG